MPNPPPPTAPSVIGLLPAGGIAARIAPLQCSKEIYPIGFRQVATASGASWRPKAVAQYVLERMRLAGITRSYFILRSGKWDIPAYFGDGTMLDMSLGYLIMNKPYGSPYTLDQAYPFVQDSLVALGFPDIIFEPANAFAALIARREAAQADVALGLFPTDQPHTADMVDADERGRVRRIAIKPAQTELRYTWMIAVWTPRFTHFLHERLAEIDATRDPLTNERLGVTRQEVYVGDIIQTAINAGFRIESVTFPDGWCLDIGNPANLIAATQRFAELAAPPA